MNVLILLFLVAVTQSETNTRSCKDMLQGYLTGQLSSALGAYQVEALRREFKGFTDVIEKFMTEFKEKIKSEVKTHTGNSSVVYTRWGKKTCPSTAELVHSGFTGGSHRSYKGSAVELLCLPRNPEWGMYIDGYDGYKAYVYGAEYETSTFKGNIKNVHDHDIPCAVCLVHRKSVVQMFPGRKTCYKGWTLENHGYLMAGYYLQEAGTTYTCVDNNPDTLHGGSTDKDEQTKSSSSVNTVLSFPLKMEIQMLIVLVVISKAETNTDSCKDILQGHLTGQLTSALGAYQVEALRRKFKSFTDIIEKSMNEFKENIKSEVKTHAGNSSAVYTRWGKKTCPSNAELVHSGFTGGSYYTDKGAAVEPLCLPRDPEWGIYNDGHDGQKNYIHGAEYETGSFKGYMKTLHDHDVPCAVCLVRQKSLIKMFPGRKTCYKGWTLEYHGYLMAARLLTEKVSILGYMKYNVILYGVCYQMDRHMSHSTTVVALPSSVN